MFGEACSSVPILKGKMKKELNEIRKSKFQIYHCIWIDKKVILLIIFLFL